MTTDTVVYGEVTVLDLVIGSAIIVVAAVLAKILTIYARKMLREKLSRDHLQVFVKVVVATVLTGAFLAAMPFFGISLSGLLVAGGVLGIVVGFASQKVVGNLISGIFLIMERPLRIADQVNIEGTAGFIEDIRLLSTIIRTYDGLFVRIPNEKVFTNNIVNLVAHEARRFEYVVGIRYSDDADEAIRIIRAQIHDEPFALQNPPADVFVDNLGDNAVNLLVRVWAPSSVWWELKKTLLWRIKTALEREGIEIAFPQRVVWLAQNERAPSGDNAVSDSNTPGPAS